MVSIKILISFFVLLNFIKVFAADNNRTQESGIVFEAVDTNKNRTATHVSTDNKIFVEYVSKLTNLLLLKRKETNQYYCISLYSIFKFSLIRGNFQMNNPGFF